MLTSAVDDGKGQAHSHGQDVHRLMTDIAAEQRDLIIPEPSSGKYPSTYLNFFQGGFHWGSSGDRNGERIVAELSVRTASCVKHVPLAKSCSGKDLR